MSRKGSGEKKFSTALFGCNKIDVNLYLESLIKSYNESLWEKESQVSELKREVEEYKRKLEEVKVEYDSISETRTKIANAFIEAQKNAEQIVENARKTATMEKHKLEAESESLRELIIEKKQTLKRLTEAASNFGNDLEEIMNHRIRMFKEDLNKAVEDSREKYIFEHIKDFSDQDDEDADNYGIEPARDYEDENVVSRYDLDLDLDYKQDNDDETDGEENENDEGNS